MNANNRLMRIFILWTLAVVVCAAEVSLDGLPPVPNPYGFDDRLALRLHLEETYRQQGLMDLSYEELVTRYRACVAPPPEPTPPPQPVIKAPDLEGIRRSNIILQLRMQYQVSIDESLTTDELDQQLRACIAGDSHSSDARPTPASTSEQQDAAQETPTEAPVQAAAAVQPIRIRILKPDELANSTGIVSAYVIEHQDERVVGIAFNSDLSEMLPSVLAYTVGSMTECPNARTALVLLGHGDGTSIGVGETPIALAQHLKTNRQTYHALLGCDRLDCVAILSCSREADAQFTAFRDGLGYYPTWRVSSWERTYQSAISGLSAVQLCLAQDGKKGFRAAVFADEAQKVGSLAEVGQRVSTRYYSTVMTDGRFVLTPTRRR